MPPPHLCVHATPLPSLKTLYKDLPATSPPSRCFIPVLYSTTTPQDCSLTSCSGYISLSVLCKHIRVRTWSATFCVYTSRGWRRFKHCKQVLNGCLLHSVGDVSLSVGRAKFNILHMQAAKKFVVHKKKHMTKKRQSSIGCGISSLEQTSLSSEL